MARRKYRFMSRYFHRYVNKDGNNCYRVKDRYNWSGFKFVTEEGLKRIDEEISLRVTKYPVIEISPVAQ